ncbi:cyclic AMP-dependent transcription factor ATF-3 isoform X1 [Anomalospiza imberbis]|uniref:cyclic AMP-dependent transcription factor ATF-3 isoform X1 n=1 Tax=Anomalospiza imberbis TaxID=187417 RepID=UPI00358E156D
MQPGRAAEERGAEGAALPREVAEQRGPRRGCGAPSLLPGERRRREEGSLGFDDFTNLTPLVKEELRFAIQNKRQFHRMSSTLDTVTVSERPVETSVLKTEFSPEEDERKKRRRERNKIAAAKCRNKKKEKTECLQKESEKLETINAELKAQIEELKNEKQHLIYMLNLHRPTCIVRAQNGRTPEDERNLFIQQIKEGTLQG